MPIFVDVVAELLDMSGNLKFARWSVPTSANLDISRSPIACITRQAK